jgi:hypothetical protein
VIFLQPIFDKSFLSISVPHTEVPCEIKDLETGGPRPQSRMDEIQTKRFFKVTISYMLHVYSNMMSAKNFLYIIRTDSKNTNTQMEKSHKSYLKS